MIKANNEFLGRTVDALALTGEEGRQAAIIRDEVQVTFDPRVSEWDNPAV